MPCDDGHEQSQLRSISSAPAWLLIFEDVVDITANAVMKELNLAANHQGGQSGADPSQSDTATQKMNTLQHLMKAAKITDIRASQC